MKNTNPILIFRELSGDESTSNYYNYSISSGLHSVVSNPNNGNLANSLFSNTMITKTREAADTVEYSE